MKKLLGIVVLGLLLSGNAYADQRNPTNQWLKTQSVNTLTQIHAYELVHTVASANQLAFTLTKPKTNLNDGKFIVVVCALEAKNTYCWLP